MPHNFIYDHIKVSVFILNGKNALLFFRLPLWSKVVWQQSELCVFRCADLPVGASFYFKEKMDMKEKKPYVSPEINIEPLGLQDAIVSSKALTVIENCLIETESKTLLKGCHSSILPCDGSIVRIGAYAFFGCKELTSLVIPNTVKEIGTHAFQNTDLKTVYYIGSPAEWSLIDIASDNDSLEAATRYYYCEDRPIDAPSQYWHYQSGRPTPWVH